MYIYVNGNSGQKVNGKSGQEHYSRVPDSVLFDRGLSGTAKNVYAVIAGSVHQGTTAKIGQRRISMLLGVHQETVGLVLKELAVRGHITIVGSGKERRIFHLHSDVFGQKQRAGLQEIVSSPSGGRRLAS